MATLNQNKKIINIMKRFFQIMYSIHVPLIKIIEARF